MAKERAIEKRWYSKQEAAIYLGLSERYLDKLRKGNKIAYLQQKEGNRPLVYFEREELDRYMIMNFKQVEIL